MFIRVKLGNVKYAILNLSRSYVFRRSLTKLCLSDTQGSYENYCAGGPIMSQAETAAEIISVVIIKIHNN